MTRREEAPVKSSPLEIPVNTRSLTVIRKLKGHGLGGGGGSVGGRHNTAHRNTIIVNGFACKSLNVFE